MTDNDDAQWAPPGEPVPSSRRSRPSASNPLAAPHPFSPEAADRAAAENAAEELVARVAPSAAEPAMAVGDAPVTETLAVGPVPSDTLDRPGRVRRGLAALAAVVLVSGGGYAAFTAATSSGGAETPEEALQLVLEAISQEDYLSAAE